MLRASPGSRPGTCSASASTSTCLPSCRRSSTRCACTRPTRWWRATAARTAGAWPTRLTTDLGQSLSSKSEPGENGGDGIHCAEIAHGLIISAHETLVWLELREQVRDCWGALLRWTARVAGSSLHG